MCGRFSSTGDAFSEIRLRGELPALVSRPPRYNIAPNPKPGGEPWILRAASEGGVEEVLARWWLIPSWWKQPLGKLRTSFNARSETAATKPFFRSAFKHRRCVVPATGWREFKGPTRPKRAFQFHLDGPFGFAGLWESWTSPEGEVVESFTILTAQASPFVEPIHDRMPIVLPKSSYLPWIHDAAATNDLLQDAIQQQQSSLQVYECSTYGNSVKTEGPECIAPLSKS